MQGRVLYLNKGFELLTGCTAHEVLGKEIQDLLQIDSTAETLRRGYYWKRGVARRTENDHKDRSSTDHHEPMLASAQ
jgi:PAS domain S-box-containing protein